MDISKLLEDGNDNAQWYKIEGTDAKVKIRKLKPKEIDAISEKCTFKKMGRRGQVIEKLDNGRYMKELLDGSVMEWKKIDLADGQALACNRENKIKLDENWMEFRTLWSSIVLGNEEAEAYLLEEERKN